MLLAGYRNEKEVTEMADNQVRNWEFERRSEKTYAFGRRGGPANFTASPPRGDAADGLFRSDMEAVLWGLQAHHYFEEEAAPLTDLGIITRRLDGRLRQLAPIMTDVVGVVSAAVSHECEARGCHNPGLQTGDWYTLLGISIQLVLCTDDRVHFDKFYASLRRQSQRGK